MLNQVAIFILVDACGCVLQRLVNMVIIKAGNGRELMWLPMRCFTPCMCCALVEGQTVKDIYSYGKILASGQTM